MISRRIISTIVVAAAFCAANLPAANSDFEIHSVPRQTDQATKGAAEGGAAVTKEHWVYDVTIENKTFKEIKDFEIKYVVFFKKEQLGVKADATPRRQTGSVTVASLQPHEKKTQSTEAVELVKKHLVGGYHYADGARPNASDTLVGVWVRVRQGGQQVAEFANPSTLLKEKWE